MILCPSARSLIACYLTTLVSADVDRPWHKAAPTASTSPLSRGLCLAHSWVHSRTRFLDALFDDLFECSNTSRSCYRPRAKLGSHSAKSRQESGGVWTVICPGKQHFANLLDSSRPARGLLHTEEVTGSIPVSPTRSGPMSISAGIDVGAIPVAKRSAGRYAAGHGRQARVGRRQRSTSITQGNAATLRPIGIAWAAGVAWSVSSPALTASGGARKSLAKTRPRSGPSSRNCTMS